MQGMIVLNEYVMEITRLNPLFVLLAVSWFIGTIAYFALKETHLSAAGIALAVEIVALFLLFFTPKELHVQSRLVKEVYLDARASIPRITETYDIIEQRGKIYVLAEKETVENK